METRLVRLKRLDPKRGYVVRRYTYRGIRFIVERGWYRVTADVAEELKSKRQVADDPHSPRAFDVLTDEEARALDERESREERPTLATEALRVEPARGEPKAEDDKGKAGGNRRPKPADA